MDEAVRKIAALGLPGVVLLIAMATTGFTGAAAITAALAMLGPGGMIGGILFLGVIGIATDALSKFGLEALLVGVYGEVKAPRRVSGEEYNSRQLMSSLIAPSAWISVTTRQTCSASSVDRSLFVVEEGGELTIIWINN